MSDSTNPQVRHHAMGFGAVHPSFTYLSDCNGLIYYSVGINSASSEDFIDVTLVYYPDKTGPKIARERATEARYAKYICHGRVAELNDARRRLPSRVFKIIRPMFQRSLVTGEQFLSIKRDAIKHIYSPKASLALLLGKTKTADPYSASLRKAISILEDLGVESQRVGLYGGLQCGIRPAQPDGLHDLDLLIEGVISYDAIVQASAGNVVDVSKFPDRIASNPLECAIAIRRGQISQFKIKGLGDVTVDMRIVRSDCDRNDYTRLADKVGDSGSDVTIAYARVIDSRQALCLPCCYEILTPVARYTVSSRYYHHVGAAHSGDDVVVRGRLAGEGYIRLVDPDLHYIIRRTHCGAREDGDGVRGLD